jgi:hypothetical protein
LFETTCQVLLITPLEALLATLFGEDTANDCGWLKLNVISSFSLMLISAVPSAVLLVRPSKAEAVLVNNAPEVSRVAIASFKFKFFILISYVGLILDWRITNQVLLN